MPVPDDRRHIPGITRRRALALGALAGAGTLVRTNEAPASAASAATAPGPRTVGLALAPGAVPGGGRPGTVIIPAEPFDLVGLRGADLRGAGTQLRVRHPGTGWSAWVPLGAGVDHAPDRPRAAPASDPVWAGGADAVQLRANRPLRGGRLQLVSVPPTPRHPRAVAAAKSDPRASGPPVIIPRSAWHAEQVPPRAPPSYGQVRLAFVHHTVTANSYTREDSARIVLSIAKYHRDSNGWNDIGYNFLVDQYGQIFEGRAGGIDAAVIGAQAGGWNSQSTGVATLGDFGKIALPEAAMAAVAQLIAWKLTLHGVPSSGPVTLISGGGKENRYPYGQSVVLQRVSGHRDGCNTDCPGAVLYGQLDALRARVAALGPVVSVQPYVTVAPDAGRVAFGQDAVVRGRVFGADNGAVGGVPVALQKQTSTGGWARVASAQTAADGSYELRAAYKRAAPLRVQAQLSPGSAGRVRSAPVSIGLDTVLAVLAPGGQSRVQAGRSLSVRGSIGPSAPVKVLVERQERGGRWTQIAQVRASVTKTTYTAVVPLRKPALYRLTVVGGRATTAPVYVRAVRQASSVTGSQGGAASDPPRLGAGAAGGASAP